MMVTTTSPCPGTASCAKARPVPITPTTVSSTAIQRVMPDLLGEKLPHCAPCMTCRTIRQEPHFSVLQRRDAIACLPDEFGLRPLDDAASGQKCAIIFEWLQTRA